MKKILYILILTYIGVAEINAQTKSDTLYVAKIDSIIQNRSNYDSNFTSVSIRDSATSKTIVGLFKNGQLIRVNYYSHLGSMCENLSFDLLNDTIIYAENHVSDLDFNRGPVGSTTYKFYFKNGAQFFHAVSHYHGGSNACNSNLINTTDYIKEFNYCEHLLLKN